MKIGHIDLGERPVFLAPMEDVTDPAFRLMCKKFGVCFERCTDTLRQQDHAETFYLRRRVSCCHTDIRKRYRSYGRSSTDCRRGTT